MPVKVSLYIPKEIAEQVEQLKRDRYKDKSYSEIYRLLLWRGLEHTVQMHKETDE